MPFPIAAVAAGATALANLAGQRSGSRKASRARQEIKRHAGPDYILPFIERVLPIFRELALFGAGPQLQSEVATGLGRHGYTGTGIGEAVRGLSVVAPYMMAFQQALGAAERASGRAVGGLSGAPVPAGTDYSSALSDAASVAALFRALGNRTQSQTFPNAYGAPIGPPDSPPSSVNIWPTSSGYDPNLYGMTP